MFKVNVHHIRPYGTGKGRKTKYPANVTLHNWHNQKYSFFILKFKNHNNKNFEFETLVVS